MGNKKPIKREANAFLAIESKLRGDCLPVFPFGSIKMEKGPLVVNPSNPLYQYFLQGKSRLYEVKILNY